MEEEKGLLSVTEKVMRVIAAVCLVSMAAMTGADVFFRGAFNSPIFGCEEIVAILGVIAVGFSLPYTHYQKSHIGVEILVRRLPKRTRDACKLVTNAATLFLVAIITWRMFLYAGTMSDSGVVSMNLELPEYWVVYVLSFGFFVYSVCLIMDIITFFKGSEA
ncbi:MULTISPECIES: TRAP transporter small permease [unclassified Pseudodesulfovibrio]|uniref:TRAP transporter small permease n=1 Tax=unclassified Pseudodesulfovibrio TaxID=2661612 RepID=UPI000FEBB0A2|nr:MULTISPECIES: TRAP transporter small permease [unclassified Pseudodesulfovibrio]MCJ2164821.1 TRAP transporter small permease [Pseudodesulfovibrio sp. S3-i]RWU03809.1 TRAP transporter small permease [Pseudodesulfovibrio sp. S3]